MGTYQTPIDICNRAMQHLGAAKIDPQLGFTEISVQAAECATAYDKVRRAELRKEFWRFAIRRTVMRPINTLAVRGSAFITNPIVSGTPVSPTMLLAPALWSSTTTYSSGALVIDASTSIWQSLAPANINAAPGNSSIWEQYTGPLTVDAWLATTAYFEGDLVYVAPGDGTYTVYQCLQPGNLDVPGTASAWSTTQVYAKDETALFSAVLYQSLVDLNYGQSPATSPAQWTTVITSGTSATSWRVLSVALQPIVLAYPVGSGPSTQTMARNVYRLPYGFLREAPQDPKSGAISYLGVMGNLTFDDWTLDGNYLTSAQSYPILYRFVADITNVTQFDDLFAEALAAKLAYETCEPITQSSSKAANALAAYKDAVSKASLVNSIEEGWVEPPLDDLIACRR